VEEVKRITLIVNKVVTEEAERIDLFSEDGKVEFGFDELRNAILVDVLGTPDECRFTFEGIPMSKEIARIFYRKTPWYKGVEDAKKRNKLNWKETVDILPPCLPDRLAKLTSMVYKNIANEITQRIWFRDAPPLKEIMYGIRDFIS
jgi:phosphoribosylaminoimidazole-succinocarboxamide synthase